MTIVMIVLLQGDHDCHAAVTMGMMVVLPCL
jgi:hypothetical protein